MTTETAPRPETDDANEAAVQAARDAYHPAYEQGLGSDIASCADWFGWHAAIKAVREQILREELGDLRERLFWAVSAAKEARDDLDSDDPAWMHRAGKVDGIKLALSYLPADDLAEALGYGPTAARTATPIEETQR